MKKEKFWSKYAKAFDPAFPLDRLVEADYNPREIDPAAKKTLAATLKRFGMVEWIVWNERTGTIVSGHQRAAILKEQGETVAPVLIIDVDLLTEKQINVTLNNEKLEGDWDTAKLETMQTALEPFDFGPLDLGAIGTAAARDEGTETEPGADVTGEVKSGEYLKVFRLHFLPDEWETFEERGNAIMKKHGLENYSELVLWLARNYAI